MPVSQEKMNKDEQRSLKERTHIVQASGTKHPLSTASTNFPVSCLAKCWATLGIGDYTGGIDNQVRTHALGKWLVPLALTALNESGRGPPGLWKPIWAHFNGEGTGRLLRISQQKEKKEQKPQPQNNSNSNNNNNNIIIIINNNIINNNNNDNNIIIIIIIIIIINNNNDNDNHNNNNNNSNSNSNR